MKERGEEERWQEKQTEKGLGFEKRDIFSENGQKKNKRKFKIFQTLSMKSWSNFLKNSNEKIFQENFHAKQKLDIN